MHLPTPDNLWAAVVHPQIEILTKVAREILPKEIPVNEATQQMGNLGAFVTALYENDYELIGRSLQDVIAEPRRQKLIPEFYRAKQAAMAEGALGFSISGAGPSVFALCEGEEVAKKAGEAISKVFGEAELGHTVYVSAVYGTAVL